MKKYPRTYRLITRVKRSQGPTDRKPHHIIDAIPFDGSRVSGSIHRATKLLGNCMVCHKPVKKGQLYVQPFIMYADRVHAQCHHYPCFLAVRIRTRTLKHSAAVWVWQFNQPPDHVGVP